MNSFTVPEDHPAYVVPANDLTFIIGDDEPEISRSGEDSEIEREP